MIFIRQHSTLIFLKIINLNMTQKIKCKLIAKPNRALIHVFQTALIYFLSSIVLLSAGCGPKVNYKGFEIYSPKRVGVALGYDPRTVCRSEDVDVLIWALFGALGVVVTETENDRTGIKNVGLVDRYISKHITEQLENKGYETYFISKEHINYSAFEGVGSELEHFDSLLKKYSIHTKSLDEFDALLFIENHFVFRLKDYGTLEKLTLKEINM